MDINNKHDKLFYFTKNYSGIRYINNPTYKGEQYQFTVIIETKVIDELLLINFYYIVKKNENSHRKITAHQNKDGLYEYVENKKRSTLSAEDTVTMLLAYANKVDTGLGKAEIEILADYLTNNRIKQLYLSSTQRISSPSLFIPEGIPFVKEGGSRKKSKTTSRRRSRKNSRKNSRKTSRKTSKKTSKKSY